MDHSDVTAYLERFATIPVRRDSDLPRDTRRRKHSLGTRVDQGKERGLLGTIRAIRTYERDVHHWPVDIPSRWVRPTTRRILRIGEDPWEGAAVGQLRQGLPEPDQFGLMLLLGGNAEHTGVANPLGSESLEEGIGRIGRINDLTALDGHPLAFEPAEHLGQTQRFHHASLSADSELHPCNLQTLFRLSSQYP
jgi:hypothetical protein